MTRASALAGFAGVIVAAPGRRLRRPGASWSWRREAETEWVEAGVDIWAWIKRVVFRRPADLDA